VLSTTPFIVRYGAVTCIFLPTDLIPSIPQISRLPLPVQCCQLIGKHHRRSMGKIKGIRGSFQVAGRLFIARVNEKAAREDTDGSEEDACDDAQHNATGALQTAWI